ncbi:MAG: hypothetical protein WBW71_12050 [Bacteroidota bacterium]
MIKLHIGCFDVPLAGWYNTDVTPNIIVARIPFLAGVLQAFGLIDNHRWRQHKNGVFRALQYLNALKKIPFHDEIVGQCARFT